MSNIIANEEISRVFQSMGLCDPVKIQDTLQGSIWRASTTQTISKITRTAVIKVTNKLKHEQSLSIIDGRRYKVEENILLEQSILKYLTQQKQCPESIVKFILFSQTNTDYFLVMEDGKCPLFDFVQKVHEFLRAGIVEIKHWKEVVKVIFKQIIECIQFTHSKNICHNDISLENFLINDVAVEELLNGKIRFITDDIQIKLCDFGLAELHTKPECLSVKFCGKTQYKSPEVLRKEKAFKGKNNDVWCAGVCLFMLLFGCAPWSAGSIGDVSFDLIMNGNTVDVLKAWNLGKYMDEDVIDLFESIFKYEDDRIGLEEMKQHPWFTLSSQ